MCRKALIKFSYNGNVHSIEYTKDEKIKDIYARLAAKIGIDIKNFDFYNSE